MTERAKAVPPYVPWRTFENYLDGLKAFGTTLPNVIDRASMHTLSGATQTQVLHALRFLNMIDAEGLPKPRLSQIVQATQEERQTFYQQLIKAEYPFVADINLQGATPKQIDDAFATTGATGDTVRKSVAFFIGLAKAANIKLSPLISKGRRPKSNSNGNRRATKREPKGKTKPQDQPPPSLPPLAQSPYEVLIAMLDPRMEDDEQAAIWTLIRYLKKREVASDD